MKRAADERLDETFKALADPTRRQVLELLGRAPASMSELAAPFDITLPSMSKHLDVLEACGLVSSSKAGRVRTFRIEPRRLDGVAHWLEAQRAMWLRRLDQLDDYLQTIKEEHDP